MKHLKHVFALFALCLFAGQPLAADSPAVDFQIALFAPVPAHASLYSYADVYRLTVAGPAMAGFPLATTIEAPALADSAVRVANAELQAAGFAFSIRPASERDRWMLLACGLAVALWVARRRLSHPL
jgi:hypothetical protein